MKLNIKILPLTVILSFTPLFFAIIAGVGPSSHYYYNSFPRPDSLRMKMSSENSVYSESKKASSDTKLDDGLDYNSKSDEQSEKDRFQRILIKEANYNPSPSNNFHGIENYTPKRTSYLDWQPYFLAIAKLTSQRSKDPHQQVGACIVDSNNRILGCGYNGFPRGCSDDILPWSSYSSATTVEEKSANGNNVLHFKEFYEVKAEINAILNKIGNVDGATMYVYGSFPCNECAKVIIQAGIKEVVYMDINDSTDKTCENKMKASRILFGLAGVKLTNYTGVLHNSEDGRSMIPIIPALNFETQNDTVTNENPSSIEASKLNDTNSISEEHRQLLVKEANYDPIEVNQQLSSSQDTNNSNKRQKRQGYLSWDDYFTAVASLSAYRSKDPNTQVGACIVDENKCIIGIGYNGFPRNCSDDHLPWSRRGPNPLHTKYLYVVHAEVNAVLNKGTKDCTGATLYVALFPCNECAKVIIQSGIKEVVYLSDTYHDTDICKASRVLLEMAGVKCRQYFPSRRKINVDILNRNDD